MPAVASPPPLALALSASPVVFPPVLPLPDVDPLDEPLELLDDALLDDDPLELLLPDDDPLELLLLPDDDPLELLLLDDPLELLLPAPALVKPTVADGALVLPA